MNHRMDNDNSSWAYKEQYGLAYLQLKQVMCEKISESVKLQPSKIELCFLHVYN